MKKTSAPIRYQGTITRWDDDRGFGFIAPNGGSGPVFIHIKAFGAGARRPRDGDIVTFIMQSGERGKQQAGQAAFVRSRAAVTRQAAYQQSSSVLTWAAVVFLGMVGLSAWSGKMPMLVLGAYLGLSLLTFLVYRADKSAARQGRWRTQEQTLLALGLAGGWPGALIAQRRLRHKSSKRAFQVAFWLTVLLNCAALLWLRFYWL